MERGNIRATVEIAGRRAHVQRTTHEAKATQLYHTRAARNSLRHGCVGVALKTRYPQLASMTSRPP